MTIALATVALVVWRLITGTPPRRRTFLIGGPIAVFFLLSLVAIRGMLLFEVDAPRLEEVIGWSLVISRASIWYGFLLALVAAELFAGRMLRRMVTESLRRPAPSELEAMLRGPLGDPDLRLEFRGRNTNTWVGARGAGLEPPDPSSGRSLTEVERDGRVAAVIDHDAQLAEEPELLQAAGATRCSRRRTRSSRRGGRRPCASCRIRAAASSPRASSSGASSSATFTTERSSASWRFASASRSQASRPPPTPPPARRSAGSKATSTRRSRNCVISHTASSRACSPTAGCCTRCARWRCAARARSR